MKAPWNRQIQSDRTLILRIWEIQILTIFYHCFLSSHGSDPMVAQVLLGLSRLPKDRKRSMRAPWNRQKELVPATLFSSFSDLFDNEFWSGKFIIFIFCWRWNSNNTWWNMFQYSIFQIISITVRSVRVWRFQGAFMGPKKSIKTCFTVDSLLKTPFSALKS